MVGGLRPGVGRGARGGRAEACGTWGAWAVRGGRRERGEEKVRKGPSAQA